MQKLIPWAAGSLTFNLAQSWQKNRDCNKNAFKTFKLQKHSRTSLKVLLRAETLAINSGHTQTNQHGTREDLDAGKGKKTKQGGCVLSFPTTEIEYLLCSQMRNRQKAAMQKFHKVRHDAKRNGNAKWQKDNKDAAVTADGKRTSRHVSWQPAFETSGLPVFRKTTTVTKPSDTKQQEGRKKRRTRMSSLPKTQTSKRKKKGSKLKRKLGRVIRKPKIQRKERTYPDSNFLRRRYAHVFQQIRHQIVRLLPLGMKRFHAHHDFPLLLLLHVLFHLLLLLLLLRLLLTLNTWPHALL